MGFLTAQLKVFWKDFKWVLLVVGGVLAVVLAFLLRGLVCRKRAEATSEESQSLPSIDEQVEERVVQAEEEATVARIEARVRAEADREQLERINQVDDGAERRRQLAAMLRRL